MDISSSMTTLQSSSKASAIKPLFTQKLTDDEVASIKEELKSNSQKIAFNSVSVQNQSSVDEFKSFLSDIGYSGKPIAELSQEEASELVSEDGFFGIDKTSQRIADFVINGSAGDESLMRAGREGMLQGFKDAESIWGGELPEISQKTMAKSIELVDKAMYDLGFSVLDTEV